VLGMASSVVIFSSHVVFVDFVQALDSGMNTVILISAALFFLITVESRRKQNRVLTAIHKGAVLLISQKTNIQIFQ